MFGLTRKRAGTRRPAPPSAPPSEGPCAFGVKTRIGKTVGKNERYACRSVRALPSTRKDEVILQSTDGHQAACLLTRGQMTDARMVPPEVLPTRQLAKPAGIRLIDGRWESLEGRLAPDATTADISFPAMGDVLPVVGKHPYYETAAQAQQRRVSDPAASMHIVLGIDLDLLRKSSEALGATKLTLLIPVPVKDPNQRPGEVCVNKPVAVCPATRDPDLEGIAVVMPLAPENGTAYYMKVRETVAAAEKAIKRATAPVSAQPRPLRAG